MFTKADKRTMQRLPFYKAVSIIVMVFGLVTLVHGANLYFVENEGKNSIYLIIMYECLSFALIGSGYMLFYFVNLMGKLKKLMD